MGFNIPGSIHQVFQNNSVVGTGEKTVLIRIDFLDIKKDQRCMGKEFIQGLAVAKATGVKRGVDTLGANLF